ncbi:MAG: hypothetical protein FJ095_12165 [Deltaproteobacteria bacterium]|nr:hypothetical protein [Deltaproteobacteria bacterium]
MGSFRLVRVSIVVALAGLGFMPACREEPRVEASVASIAAATVGPSSSGSVVGMTTTGMGGQGGEAPEAPPLKLGVASNPAHPGDGEASAAATLSAELVSYAAGVRAVVVPVSWSAVESTAGLDALAARVAGLRERALDVVLAFEFVDRRWSGRPVQLAGVAWDADESKAALDAALAAVVARVGKDASALVLGRGVDVHAASLPDGGVALAAALEHAVATVSVLPGAPAHLAVGLARAPLDKIGVKLASIGGASAFSYAPGLGADAVPSVLSAASDLDAMIELAAKRPIFLLDVSFTSAASLGATPSAQAQHLTTFFSALEPRRGAFRVVSVTSLHDLGSSACSQHAARQGLALDAPEITFACASGLRESDGAPKLSWQAFLEASAAYSPP